MGKLRNKRTYDVFVYGTLRQDQVSTHILRGYKLYDLGPFPCILPVEGGVVYGNLITGLTVRELAALDRVEGVSHGFYTREEVVVESRYEVPTLTSTAYVYVAGNVLDEAPTPREVVSGDWHRHPRKQRNVFSPYN